MNADNVETNGRIFELRVKMLSLALHEPEIMNTVKLLKRKSVSRWSLSRNRAIHVMMKIHKCLKS